MAKVHVHVQSTLCWNLCYDGHVVMGLVCTVKMWMASQSACCCTQLWPVCQLQNCVVECCTGLVFQSRSRPFP